jgi:predicted nucleotidyltransferase
MNQVVAFPPVTEELLQEAVRQILSVGSPEKIVLFGSWARGQARPDSDLDLLIIEESDLPRYRRAGRYRMALLGLFPAKDIVVWTPSEVALRRDVPNAFITAILAEGRVLYERSDRSSPRLAAPSL